MLKYTIAKKSTVAFPSVNIAFGFIFLFIEHDLLKNPNRSHHRMLCNYEAKKRRAYIFSPLLEAVMSLYVV